MENHRILNIGARPVQNHTMYLPIRSDRTLDRKAYWNATFLIFIVQFELCMRIIWSRVEILRFPPRSQLQPCTWSWIFSNTKNELFSFEIHQRNKSTRSSFPPIEIWNTSVSEFDQSSASRSQSGHSAGLDWITKLATARYAVSYNKLTSF